MCECVYENDFIYMWISNTKQKHTKLSEQENLFLLCNFPQNNLMGEMKIVVNKSFMWKKCVFSPVMMEGGLELKFWN